MHRLRQRSYFDEYCTVCGHRRAEPDRDETNLGGIVLITDRGIEHARNEDAAAAGILVGSDAERPDAIAVAVCDGVSSSDEAHRAAVAASTAGVDAMLAALVASQGTRGGAGGSGVRRGGGCGCDDPATRRRARIAAMVVPTPAGTARSRSAASAPRGVLASRPPAQQLTADDSVAQGLITAGAAADSGSRATRRAHADPLARRRRIGPWSESSVRCHRRRPRLAVLCSDGLWNCHRRRHRTILQRYRRDSGGACTHRIRVGCRWSGQHHRRNSPDRRAS